jgi:hypothetical protein
MPPIGLISAGDRPAPSHSDSGLPPRSHPSRISASHHPEATSGHSDPGQPPLARNRDRRPPPQCFCRGREWRLPRVSSGSRQIVCLAGHFDALARGAWPTAGLSCRVRIRTFSQLAVPSDLTLQLRSRLPHSQSPFKWIFPVGEGCPLIAMFILPCIGHGGNCIPPHASALGLPTLSGVCPLGRWAWGHQRSITDHPCVGKGARDVRRGDGQI